MVFSLPSSLRKVTHHVIFKEVQNKCNSTSVNTNEEINARQENIGSAGDVKIAGGRVHHRNYGPSAYRTTRNKSGMIQLIKIYSHKPPSPKVV